MGVHTRPHRSGVPVTLWYNRIKRGRGFRLFRQLPVLEQSLVLQLWIMMVRGSTHDNHVPESRGPGE